MSKARTIEKSLSQVSLGTKSKNRYFDTIIKVIAKTEQVIVTQSFASNPVKMVNGTAQA